MGEPEFQRLFECAPAACLVLTPDLTVATATDEYLRAIDKTREAVVGRTVFEVIESAPFGGDAASWDDLRASFERVLATCGPDEMAPRRGPEGDPLARVWRPVNSPVFGDDGALSHIVHRVDDVTRVVRAEERSAESERRAAALEESVEEMAVELLKRSNELAEINRGMRAANEELNALYEKTRELDRLKTQFFANVSHELRTPLTLILGPVERMLAADDVDPRCRRDLKSVARNARTLLCHVNDLLDLTKIEAGRMGLALARVDLARAVRIVAAHFESHADERGIALTVDAPEELLAVVDGEKVQRVLLNLLSNALRFTPDGGRVRCSVRGDHERARVEVADSGPGVPPDQRGVVFERFRQLEGGDTRRRGGTGLGLAIVREIVELHGGEVTVDQAPEGGARFVVALPRRVDEGAALAVEVHALDVDSILPLDRELRASPAAVGPCGDPSLPRVLIAEDNPEMNRFLRESLADGWCVEAVFDGREGIARATASPPDLIVTDMMMPHASGEELVRALRANPALDSTPIVVLTARSDDALRLRALRSGAQDFITKPFSVDELRARLGNLLAMRRAEDRVRRLGESLAERNRELEGLTAELKAANAELEAFSFSVAHDLRAPLRSIDGFSAAVLEDHGDKLGEEGRADLRRVRQASRRMASLIDDLLALSRVSREGLQRERFDLSREVRSVVARLCESDPTRATEVVVAPGLAVDGDPRWLRVALENLLGNAWKFSARRSLTRIEVGRTADGAYFVRDHGAGFDMAYADKLFRPFQRLHAGREFEGTGVGLATVLRIVTRHGGRIWAEGAVDEGATFFFTLARGAGEAAADTGAYARAVAP